MNTSTSLDSELFFLGGDNREALVAQARALEATSSRAPLGLLASEWAERANPVSLVRAAIVVRDHRDMRTHLGLLKEVLSKPFEGVSFSPTQTLWWSSVVPGKARVGLAFPGNGVQRLDMGRALVRAFPWARYMLQEALEVLQALGAPDFSKHLFRPEHPLDEAEEQLWTERLSCIEISAPAIQFVDALWARYLEIIGIKPVATCGHSQGEQAAMYAAGAISFRDLMELSVFMARAGSPTYNAGTVGRMAVLPCSREFAESLIEKVEGYVVVAAVNGPAHVTLSGEPAAMDALQEAASQSGVDLRPIPVYSAFHSRLVEAGVGYMLANGPPIPPIGRPPVGILSGLSGDWIGPGVRPLTYFGAVCLQAIDFERTARALAEHVDLMLEVGPGRGMSSFVRRIDPGYVCLPLEPEPCHARALQIAGAALFAHGATVKWDLFMKTVRRAWGSAEPAR